MTENDTQNLSAFHGPAALTESREPFAFILCTSDSPRPPAHKPCFSSQSSAPGPQQQQPGHRLAPNPSPGLPRGPSEEGGHGGSAPGCPGCPRAPCPHRALPVPVPVCPCPCLFLSRSPWAGTLPKLWGERRKSRIQLIPVSECLTPPVCTSPCQGWTGEALGWRDLWGGWGTPVRQHPPHTGPAAGLLLAAGPRGAGMAVLQKGTLLRRAIQRNARHALGRLSLPAGGHPGDPRPRGRARAVPGSRGIPPAPARICPTAGDHQPFPLVGAGRELWHGGIAAIGRGSVFTQTMFC